MTAREPAPEVPLPRILFVCVENSCRSQMAEAFARMDAGDLVESHSAGSAASGVVNPTAIQVMAELDYDLSTHRSKTPADLPAGTWDLVVSMGCGDRCPNVPARHREDWDVPDPKHEALPRFREIRDDIRARVRRAVASLIP